MRHGLIFGTVCLALATAAWGHQGVKNPGVMARMEAMKQVGTATKVLGDMAKQKTAFSETQAKAAKAALVRHLSEAEPLFRDPHADPKSEALPVIWEDYARFEDMMRKAARAAQRMDVSDLDALRVSMRAVAKSCSGCHEDYRE